VISSVNYPCKTAFYAPTATLQQALVSAAKEHSIKLQSASALFDAVPVQVGEELMVIGPGMAAPVAALIVETIAKSAIERIILLSVGAALTPNIKELEIGSIIVPTGAISEEGTSQLYQAQSLIPNQESTFQNTITSAISRDLQTPISSGLIWSTDAPCKESAEKVQDFQSRGAIAVDMEYSALLHLCQLKNIQLAAVFVVSDLVGQSWESGFKSKIVKNNIRRVADSLVKYIRQTA